jgi:hypothetical protein
MWYTEYNRFLYRGTIMAAKGKKGKIKSKMKMSSYETSHESKHKTHMRVITLIIACIVILGLVIIFPFADANVNAEEDSKAVTETFADDSGEDGVLVDLPEVSVTSQGAGMFTLKNAALIGGGFAVGFLLGELFRKVNKYRERQTDGQR